MKLSAFCPLINLVISYKGSNFAFVKLIEDGIICPKHEFTNTSRADNINSKSDT